jgi:hypothetical protein
MHAAAGECAWTRAPIPLAGKFADQAAARKVAEAKGGEPASGGWNISSMVAKLPDAVRE